MYLSCSALGSGRNAAGICAVCTLGSQFGPDGSGKCASCGLNTVCGPVLPSAASCINGYGLTPAVAPSLLATCNACVGAFIASTITSPCSCPTIAVCDKVSSLVISW